MADAMNNKMELQRIHKLLYPETRKSNVHFFCSPGWNFTTRDAPSPVTSNTFEFTSLREFLELELHPDPTAEIKVIGAILISSIAKRFPPPYCVPCERFQRPCRDVSVLLSEAEYVRPPISVIMSSRRGARGK